MNLVRTAADAIDDMKDGLPAEACDASTESPWPLLDYTPEGGESTEVIQDSDLQPEEHLEYPWDEECADEVAAEAGSGPKGLAEQLLETPKKVRKKKVTVPPEAKAWFLEYSFFQASKYGWPVARSLRMAKELAPDLFRDVNKDTPAR